MVTVFIVLSFVTYGRATRVYADRTGSTRMLSQAYIWGLEPTTEDKFIHPAPEFVTYLKRELQLLEIGPYGNRGYAMAELPVGKFVMAGLLSANRKIAQSFTASENGLKSLSFKFVTPNGDATQGTVTWQLTEVGSAQPIGSGSFDARRARTGCRYGSSCLISRPARAKHTNSLFRVPAMTHTRLASRCMNRLPPAIRRWPVSDQDDALRRNRLTMELTTEYAQ